MNDLSRLTTKEIEKILASQPVTAEFLAAARLDPRKAAQRAVKCYEKKEKEHERLMYMYDYERKALAEGCQIIAGVDEAGRGPLAGPVSVAAVILPFELELPKLNDSKKLSAKVRDELYAMIKEHAISIAAVFIDAKTIDRINIYQATMNGMYDVIAALNPVPDKVLIDAMPLAKLSMAHESIIKGDAKSASIAAASIIAKVSRDRLMDEYDKKYPEYGFAHHKGYGTAEHIAAIKKYGPCPIHRLTFEPLRSMIKGYY